MKRTYNNIGSFLSGKLEKSKMAAGKKHFLTNHNVYILKMEFNLLALYINNIYIYRGLVIRLGMVIKDSFVSLTLHIMQLLSRNTYSYPKLDIYLVQYIVF